MTATLDRDNDQDISVALALIQKRIAQLPSDDQNDLFDLFAALSDADENERAKIGKLVREILSGEKKKEKSSIKRIKMAAVTPQKSLEQWLSFVSQRIRAAREAAGMTQEELADESGIQQAHICRLEKGEHSPTHKTLKRIADATGQKVSYFDPSSPDAE